eukprot:13414037-Ditylum_brightwellii.AAC.1
MGNVSSRQEDSTLSNLKLESQKIVEFTGWFDDWQKWKTQTQCAFDESGYEQILINWDFATSNSNMNRIVYSQLSVATTVGTTYHLVKQFEKEKDGHAAWSTFVEWFDGDVMRTKKQR